ncbi:hypothetical protein PsYK624_003560 [Phanerochaete sordida]|uniref:Uncharacterized protein n=1 Tax=Phanerochaete sordida TaxID=48140 RepID=A0A9P3L6W2_9APHY|nr:hypothetical protein PsYK624_003560 [Phanerochaete sordida]
MRRRKGYWASDAGWFDPGSFLNERMPKDLELKCLSSPIRSRATVSSRRRYLVLRREDAADVR